MALKKVAVIGAGISGLTTACFLAEESCQVTVYEKQAFPPVNPSTIAGGMMAPFSEIESLPIKFVQAGLMGIQLWRKILGEKSGIYFKEDGSLIVAHQEDAHMLNRFAQHLPSITKDWEWIDAQGIRTLEPNLENRFSKGLYIPQEAHILPLHALEALHQKLLSLDGAIIQKEVCPEGLLSAYDWVIDCRGYVEDIDIDLRGIKGEIVLVQNHEFSLQRPVRLMHPRYPLYIVPRPDHVFAIGATMIESSGNEMGLVTLRSAMELMSAAYSLHPSFGEAEILDMSSGIRAAYADNLPRIQIDRGKRYIRSNGLFRHGYLLSPVMARCIANFIKTEEEDENFVLFSGRLNHVAFLENS